MLRPTLTLRRMKVRRASDVAAPPGLEHAGLHGAFDSKMDELYEEQDKFRHGFEIETEEAGVSAGRVRPLPEAFNRFNQASKRAL